MDIVLMGAPGAGKGTQAVKLEQQLDCKHISTGDILRKEIASGSELGKKIAAIIDNGDFISDEMMVSILKKVISSIQQDIVFDGFPRTLAQAKILDDILHSFGRKLGKAIMISLSEQEVIDRLSARKQCRLPDGKVKQIGQDFSAEQCQLQGGEIFVRPDDTPEHVQHRLAVYHQRTEPVIEFYKSTGLYAQINGAQSPEKVFEDLLKVLKA